MHIRLPSRLRARLSEVLGLTQAHDEGILAGPGEEALQALGAPAPVVSLVGANVAALCPDLVHEAQWSLSHRD
jgi:hypothetical protein